MEPSAEGQFVEAPVRRLGDILALHSISPDFDLLSLEIEDENTNVLNDLIDSSPFRPLRVIVEASYDLNPHLAFWITRSASASEAASGRRLGARSLASSSQGQKKASAKKGGKLTSFLTPA